MNDIQFAEKMSKYLFKPFFVGDPAKGWDCLNSLHDFFKSENIQFPSEYKGWNEQNYAERWSRGEGNEVLREFLMSLGETVDLNYISKGDIIIFSKNGRTSSGMYLGNGNFRAHHPKEGVIVLPFRFFRHIVVGVRRLK